MNKVNNKIKENFTTIPNSVIRNKALSDRARFLFCYMASMPNDWQFYQSAMAKELGYTKDTLRKYMEELLSTGYLIREQRREKGKFDSYDYTINFSPFMENTDTVKNHSGKNPTREKSTVTNKDFEQRKNNTNIDLQKECEMPFTPPQPKIKNSFARQSIHDSISHEQGFKEKEKSTREKEKESQEPTETYSAFIAFCQAYENCAKVTLPKNKQGNYIMSAKDGSNCKKLISWIKQIAVVEGTMDEMVAAFTKAAWHVSDKFMKNNFSISMIYSNANAIYTKFHYQNPAAQEKRRQEEIERLVNEFEG
jgi:predicted transcriptional regulator